MLRFGPDHESGHVLNKQERRPMTITSIDEIGDFLSRLRVNNSTEPRRAARGIAKHSTRIRNHANLNAADGGMAGNDLFRVVSLKLIQVSVIQNAIEQSPHVVGLAMIFGNDFVDIL